MWDFTRISVAQNNLQELKGIWDQWDDEIKQLLYYNYVLESRLQLLHFWKVDLVPTVEEYMTLIRCPKIQANKDYSRPTNVPTFLKKLMSITGMSEQWVTTQIKQNGDSKCIPSKKFRDLILAHPDMKKGIDVFALSIYGLRAPWMILDEILYRYRGFDWVPLLRIWGAFRYAPLLVLRQYKSRQFIPATQGFAQCKFLYKGDNHKKKVNDNILVPSQEDTRPIEEHLQVIPYELEIIKQEFGKKSSEAGLRARVAELEKSLHQYCSCNSAIELSVSLTKIDELKGKIGELESVLQNCKLRVEFLGKNNEHWKEQLQRSQGQVRDRDYIMGDAVTQIQEVVDHLQTLAVQVDILSLKYESEPDQGRELAWLLRKVKAFSIRAK
ncbi:hypothetical protein Gorai_016842, partial [Gossypium raimondii]|nr:hypothetical protein [Gossypium raimondii]